MLLKVDCLPNAVGKQPSIPLIYYFEFLHICMRTFLMMNKNYVNISSPKTSYTRTLSIIYYLFTSDIHRPRRNLLCF